MARASRDEANPALSALAHREVDMTFPLTLGRPRSDQWGIYLHCDSSSLRRRTNVRLLQMRMTAAYVHVHSGRESPPLPPLRPPGMRFRLAKMCVSVPFPLPHRLSLPLPLAAFLPFLVGRQRAPRDLSRGRPRPAKRAHSQARASACGRPTVVKCPSQARWGPPAASFPLVGTDRREGEIARPSCTAPPPAWPLSRIPFLPPLRAVQPSSIAKVVKVEGRGGVGGGGGPRRARKRSRACDFESATVVGGGRRPRVRAPPFFGRRGEREGQGERG